MKCLTITVDDMTLFSGEVAEFQWTENPESITVQGRFRPQANILEQIKQAAAQRQPRQVPEPPTIPNGTVAPPAHLNVVPPQADDE